MQFNMLGVCWDKTQTCRKGAAKAPDIIRKSLTRLETWHAGVELADSAFLKDLGNIKAKNFDSIAQKMFSVFEKNSMAKKKGSRSMPLILGGEHTISLAAVKALKPRRVVIFDAHPDVEDSNGHNGVVRRIADIVGNKNITLFGVRTLSREEDEWIVKNKIHVATLKDLMRIDEPVYLSIDFDVLDPQILPAVGNPEPAGLRFIDLLEAIRALAPNIKGLDFVEFTPYKCPHATEIHALTAGKLIYATMAEIIRAQEMNKEK